jgi:AAA+ superfamily predicted ATPase
MSPRARTALIWVALLLLALAAVSLGMRAPGGGGRQGAVAGRAPAHDQTADLYDAVPAVGPEVLLFSLNAGDVIYTGIRADGDVVAWLQGEAMPLRVEGPVPSDLLQAIQDRGLVLQPLPAAFDDGADDGAYDGAYDADGAELVPADDPLVDLLAIVLVAAVLLIGLVVWRRRQVKAQGGIMEMRKSTARRLETASQLRFDDIGGAVEVKERLADVIACLRDPEGWAKAGVRLPRGVLLEGPPGCGKTMMARAVAGEAGVPVFVLSASELVEMFVGVGASRVRDMFEQARAAAPAVLFIDELDAIGRRRGAGVMSAAHDEREQTLNQLLVGLDGVDAPQGKRGHLVVMAATNRADILDPALLRPGRFDIKLRMGPPDASGRAAVLRLHTKGRVMGQDVQIEALAEQTAGLSGAELELICAEATLRAARRAGGPGSTAVVGAADLAHGLAQVRRPTADFDVLDAVLIESQGQIARPPVPLEVVLDLLDGTERRGQLVWIDASWVKLRAPVGAVTDGAPAAGGATEPVEAAILVPKAQLRGIRARGPLAAADAAATLRQLPQAPGVG